MNYLPIFIDVRARRCLVVGGGQVAARKVELLRSAGAVVHVVAPELCAELQTLASEGALAAHRREYAAHDLDQAWLVVAATDSTSTNARVATDAGARSIPINVVDAPALCTFVMPAIIDRSPVLVAVSTAGASPVLARLTRGWIERALPDRLGRLAEFAARFRATVKARVPESAQRRAFWERILDGEVAQLVLAGRELDAEREIAAQLEARPPTAVGRVTLIAAGDGELGRLSLDTLRALAGADVLMHERAVLPVVQAFGRRDAERVELEPLNEELGAASGRAQFALAVQHAAAAGRRVCVVRAADPYATNDSAEVRTVRELGLGLIVLRPAPSPAPSAAKF